MLVLARRAQESLEFPELGVVIQVVSVKTNKVNLGIIAPQRIKIRRTELPPQASELEPSEKNQRRSFESHRLSHELSRLESQIAALTELASPSNQELAKQVAADSQKQIDKINRLLLLVSESSANEAPVERTMGDSAWSNSSAIASSCVRQSSAPFIVCDSNESGSIEFADECVVAKTVWFPGMHCESERAIA